MMSDTYLKLERLGHGITDSCAYSDRLRCVDMILVELKDKLMSFDTGAMSEESLVRQGVKIGLSEIIDYLERV